MVIKKKIYNLFNYNLNKLEQKSIDFDFCLNNKNTNISKLNLIDNNFLNENTKTQFNLEIGKLSGRNSFSFRVTLKEYKQGLNASKYSLLLNQFGINPNNFIFLINEILVNNFPLTIFETLFKTNLDEINLKINFLVIISKLGINSHFLIIPKGIIFSQLRSQIWPIFINKLIYLYIKKVANRKNRFNLNRFFLLATFYIYKYIMYKLEMHKNILKDYTNEEYLNSVGNYYTFKLINFNYFTKINKKCPYHELQFSYTNIFDSITTSTKFNVDFYENIKKNLIEFKSFKKNVY